MGGSGSGSWYRWNSRDTVEECRSIDIREWKRKGLLTLGNRITTTWTSWTGDKNSIGAHVEANRVVLHYRQRQSGEADWQNVATPIHLDWTDCHLGGKRVWFLCPGCKRRVAKLFQRGEFQCRHCNNLAYESTREHLASRLTTKAQNIRRRLGGSASLLEPFPDKPKGMWQRTYDELRRQAEMYESTGMMVMAKRLGMSFEL